MNADPVNDNCINTVCRDIFQAIYQNKWLSIEYKNRQDELTDTVFQGGQVIQLSAGVSLLFFCQIYRNFIAFTGGIC